jgi:hypothetical protein
MTVPASDIDARIGDLRGRLDRSRINLTELDANVTRRLLEASGSLTGRTAEAWVDARQRWTGLWEGQLALDDALATITEARGTRATPTRAVATAVSRLLDGECVRVTEATGTPAALTEGPRPATEYTIEALLARMSDDYGSVLHTVDAVAAVWNGVGERLAVLDTTVAELEATADRLGVHHNELAAARHAVDDARGSVRDDPLAFDAEVVASIAGQVDRASLSLRDAERAQAALAEELAQLDRRVADCVDTARKARESRLREASKILIPDSIWDGFIRAETDAESMRRELDEIIVVAAENPVGARRRMVDVRGRARALAEEVERLSASDGNDIATRDELRGRLEAYRAKAVATGSGEDLELDRLHDEARAVLYSAPCDLSRAEELVTAYQRGVVSRAKATS